MTKRLIALSLLLTVSILGIGQIVVTGTVNDGSASETLIGATVMIKGTAVGTTTDIDGNYSLEVRSEADTLVFSFVGMTSKEEVVGPRRVIDVTLETNARLMDEVVIVGYGTKLRSEITGSVSTIGAEEITEMPTLRVEQALQGRTAGVQVSQNSGSPGSPLNVRVRGIGTINNSDPLYIVDGFPTSGLDFLNPGDIESINVLKDAASAAIYGARGANGVILITTKQGRREQQGQVSYETYYGQQSPWKKMNLLDAREYAVIINEAHMASGKAAPFDLAELGAIGEGTDWQDAIFEDAPISNHSLSITGGSQRSTYSINASHFNQEGIVGGPKSAFQRTTARFNSTHDVSDKFSMGSMVTFTYLQRDALPENNEFSTPLVKALNMDPLTPVFKPDGTYAYSEFADTDITNPANQIAVTNDNWTTNRFMGNVFGEYEIIEGLTLKSTFSTDRTLGVQNLFFPTFDLSLDTALSDAPAGEKRFVNSAVTQDNKWSSWQWENVLSYTKEIGAHDLTVLAGTSALEWQYVFHGGSKAGLPSNNPDDAWLSNFTDEASQRSWHGSEEFAFLSYFGRADYTYQDRYLFSATLRADGSSRFGASNRFGVFPSASMGWIISEESFFPESAVEFLKLRASWGQNGNAEIGNYSYTSVILLGQDYALGPDETITSGAGPVATSNPDLQWETNTQTDIGVDLGLWDGRFNLTTDIFYKKTTDMLAVAPIPLIVGFEPAVTNVGDVVNKGLEIELEYRKFQGEFQFDVGGNIAFIKNEVTGLGVGGDPVNSGQVQSANSTVALTQVGQPIASFYGYVTDGIFQNQAEIDAHADQLGAEPGDIRFVDLNDDGVVNSEDQTFIGNPTPDFTYGMNFSANYKNFDFSMFLQGTYGNDIYNATVRYDFIFVNRPNDVLDRWTGEGTSFDEPRVSLEDPNQNARVSDRFVEDGSYMRIKNLQIGYTLPRDITNKIRFKSLRVYVSAQNLFTFTNYSGLDPEIGTRGSLEIGIDRGFYPQARTYLAGIQVKL